MFGVGWTEILLILVVALLVLGPGKLPEIAKGIGKGIRELKRALNGLDEDMEVSKPATYYKKSPPVQATEPAAKVLEAAAPTMQPPQAQVNPDKTDTPNQPQSTDA